MLDPTAATMIALKLITVLEMARARNQITVRATWAMKAGCAWIFRAKHEVVALVSGHKLACVSLRG